MTTDIQETLDWQGQEIDCGACAHEALRSEDKCEPRKACVQDRYARRIDRFFDQNPSLADGYLAHPYFELRAVAAKHATVFRLPPLLKDSEETVRWSAVRRLPYRYLLDLRADPHREVRIRIALTLNDDDLPSMMYDPDYYVRTVVARRISPKHLTSMMHDSEAAVRRVVVSRVEERFLMQMANDAEPSVRLEAARRLTPRQLVLLRRDPDWRVRFHVASNIEGEALAAMQDDSDPVVRQLVYARLTRPDNGAVTEDEATEILNAESPEDEMLERTS
ncbi:4Fe4S-binding leucine-rich repeat protein [Methyloceanibacter sp. wino2]|uniref:4Fe4S-binding leucine-rich repeat protein n=1 Tax=Methyloceanibacter sp. wino2 TaxID=2170729 RepID=UPI000D3EC6E2|nr:4Fe4S-binding leucine-rich repeat protein [Methyloceanibacter sp. wino2]